MDLCCGTYCMSWAPNVWPEIIFKTALRVYRLKCMCMVSRWKDTFTEFPEGLWKQGKWICSGKSQGISLPWEVRELFSKRAWSIASLAKIAVVFALNMLKAFVRPVTRCTFGSADETVWAESLKPMHIDATKWPFHGDGLFLTVNILQNGTIQNCNWAFDHY